MPYANLRAKGIVSIESPVPISADSEEPILFGFGGSSSSSLYSSFKSTLVHINKYIFRNYLLLGDSIYLSRVFSCCKNLKEIPFGLLDGFNFVRSLNSTFFYCESLKDLPENLFEHKDLSSCYLLEYMFAYCTSLEKLPDYMFDNETLLHVVNVRGMLYNCSSLLKIPEVLLKHMEALEVIDSICYGCSSLTYLPNDMFKYNSSVTSAYSIFSKCTSLLSIPRFIFRYFENVVYLESCFAECTGITEIYSDIFSNLPHLRSIFSAFMNCTNLERIIKVKNKLISGIRTTSDELVLSSLFMGCDKLKIEYTDLLVYGLENILPASITVERFLYRNSYTGVGQSNLPEIWNLANFTSYSYAFGGIGNSSSSISNYDSIPSGWK